MEAKPDVKVPISHSLQSSDANEQANAPQVDAAPHEMSHSFAVNSNLSGETINGEPRIFTTAGGVSAREEEDGEEDEGNDEGEPLRPKSFSCVDYLEIMHDEMLNPEANHASEPDVPDEESDFVCKNPQCSFSTTDMEAYLKHEYEHIDGKSYQCDVCNMKFSMFSSMRNHRMSHLSHRPYKCRLCSKEFIRKDVLLEHLVRQHSKQRPYRCPFCPKHFKLRPQLKMHLANEHSAATLIKTCKLCGFKAASPNSFRNHLAVCYLKRTFNTADSNGCNVSPMALVSSEASAIDLGAVSQNFSFVPSHYAPYALMTGDGAHPMPGPSDMTQVVSLHTTTPAVCTVSGGKTEQCPADHGQTSAVCRVSSLASSTTAAGSPNATHTANDECPQNLVVGSVSAVVKSEPSELRGEDSQNGNALPTSTMDLSTANVVETSYSCNEASCCQNTPDLPMKLKVSSYRGTSPPENCSVPAAESSASPCPGRSKMCYAVSKIRCASSGRSSACRCHTSETRLHCTTTGKRERHSDSEAHSDANTLHTEPHTCSKRSCRDKGTLTESLPEPQHQGSVCQHSACAHAHHLSRSSVPCPDNCTDTKGQINVKSIEADVHTCPFCEITFPDQTLYFLHRSLHSEAHPWKCNLCGKVFKDKYDFNSHIISQGHH